MISIQFYGQLRTAAGTDGESVDAHGESSLSDTIEKMNAAQNAAFRTILFTDAGLFRSSVIILVNGQPVSKQSPPTVKDGDDIRLMSAIAGG